MRHARRYLAFSGLSVVATAVAYDPILLGLKALGLARLMAEHPEMFSPEAALESVTAAIEETMVELSVD